MKKAIAEKWAAALRSGLYQQGAGCLRDSDNEFCCLGVLCNLHAQAHPQIAAKQTDPTSYLGEDGLLPRQVQDWAGMKSTEGEFRLVRKIDRYPVINGMVCVDLVSANDRGCDFNQIADAIEENWRRL